MKKPFQSVRVAIIAHVFYMDLWEELSRCILNVVKANGNTDIFVTIPERATTSDEGRICQAFPDAVVKRLPNRGFDVGPFFAILGSIDLDRYDYVVKLHTKRNRFGIVNFWPFMGGQWRRYLLGFCRSPKNVETALGILEDDPGVGMIGAGAVVSRPENELVGRFAISGPRRVDAVDASTYCYVAGTMFIVRVRLMRGLMRRYTFEDFPVEQIGRHSSGLAHDLEREIGHEIYEQGFYIAPFPRTPALQAVTFRFRRFLYGAMCSVVRLILRRV